MAYYFLVAQVASLFLESLMYGAFFFRAPVSISCIILELYAGLNLVSFFMCIAALLLLNGHLKRRRSINYVMTAVVLAMFTLATLDLALCLDYNIKLLMKPFADKPLVSDVAEICIFVAQTFIGNAIMVSSTSLIPANSLCLSFLARKK